MVDLQGHDQKCKNSLHAISKKDPLVKIQTFVSYLEIVWYDAAGFIIPQSVVLDLI